MHFRDNITSREAHHLQLHVLRMFWDGETQPSVEVPMGDFFAEGFGFTEKFSSALMCIVSGTPRHRGANQLGETL